MKKKQRVGGPPSFFLASSTAFLGPIHDAASSRHGWDCTTAHKARQRHQQTTWPDKSAFRWKCLQRNSPDKAFEQIRLISGPSPTRCRQSGRTTAKTNPTGTTHNSNQKHHRVEHLNILEAPEVSPVECKDVSNPVRLHHRDEPRIVQPFCPFTSVHNDQPPPSRKRFRCFRQHREKRFDTLGQPVGRRY